MQFYVMTHNAPLPKTLLCFDWPSASDRGSKYWLTSLVFCGCVQSDVYATKFTCYIDLYIHKQRTNQGCHGVM